jgi:hypothetical protein
MLGLSWHTHFDSGVLRLPDLGLTASVTGTQRMLNYSFLVPAYRLSNFPIHGMIYWSLLVNIVVMK